MIRIYNQGCIKDTLHYAKARRFHIAVGVG